MSSNLLELAKLTKYTTAIVHTRKSNWNRDSIDVSKITRLEVLDTGKYLVGRVVLKEPSNAVSISTILQIAVINLKRCIKWDLKVESQSGIKMWNLKVQHHQSGV